jgi:hypothetical protein
MAQDKTRIIEVELVVSVGVRSMADVVLGRLPEAQPVAHIDYALSRTELETGPFEVMMKFMADRMVDGMVGGIPQLRDRIRTAIAKEAGRVIAEELKAERSIDTLIDGIKFAKKSEPEK